MRRRKARPDVANYVRGIASSTGCGRCVPIYVWVQQRRRSRGRPSFRSPLRGDGNTGSHSGPPTPCMFGLLPPVSGKIVVLQIVNVFLCRSAMRSRSSSTGFWATQLICGGVLVEIALGPSTARRL
jgi:hypothetical protein